MADFTIKRGDTWRPLEATLRGPEGPIDLTDATAVRLHMRSTNAEIDGALMTVDIRTGPVDIDFVGHSRTEGKVSYQWSASNEGGMHDLEYVGDYIAEFEIEWNTGDIQTVPNDRYFTIKVVQDIDPPEASS